MHANRVLSLSLAALLLATCTSLAELKIAGKDLVKPHGAAELTLEGADGYKVIWNITPPPVYLKTVGNTVIFTGPPGGYTINAVYANFKKEDLGQLQYKVTFEGVTPPVPPVPPGPVPPGPTPPGPTPPPTPAAGLKVLILEETAELGKLPGTQISVLRSTAFRSWLDTVCDPDSNTDSGRAWTIQDKDTDLTGYNKDFQAARLRPRTGVPWIILMDGKGTVIHESALPLTIEDTKALITKYVPAKAKRKAG